MMIRLSEESCFNNLFEQTKYMLMILFYDNVSVGKYRLKKSKKILTISVIIKIIIGLKRFFIPRLFILSHSFLKSVTESKQTI